MAEFPQPFRTFRGIHTLTQLIGETASRVRFSPDGILLAIASDTIPRTYNISPPSNTPTLHREFRNGHTGPVTGLAFSSDSRFLATSSSDTTVCLWEVSSGSLIRTLAGHNGPVSCVKINRVADTIVSGSHDETIRLWDADSGACKKVIPAYSGPITDVDFSPDGSMIVACSIGGLCRIWDTASVYRMITIKEVGIPPVGSVMFSSDGRFVVIGNMDNTVRIWSMDLVRLQTFYAGQMNTYGSATFYGADERHILSGCQDNCLCIWEMLSGIIVGIIEEAHAGAVASVSCHPSYNMIASASLEDTATVKIWSPDFWL
ncbi:hypothetical protein F511_01916 [Dorcoceras hygrometricum]|uniref:WDR5-like beta-propeller domain-containing protein n=1 Tax=Dorcoceras hygrometricum TaxID=472368 RepID=A0A2Z7AU84_9LAMI|nr:hypothetical protein F511_01916 [Dorcoceras hygrometricum]